MLFTTKRESNRRAEKKQILSLLCKLMNYGFWRFEFSSKIKIFDSHMHVGHWVSSINKENILSPLKNWELDSFEKIVLHLEKYKIEKAVIVPIYSQDKLDTYKINEFVLDISKSVPKKVIPAFWLDPSPEVGDLLQKYLFKAGNNAVRVFKMSSEVWSGSYSPDPNSWDTKFRENINTILNHVKQTKSIIQMHTGSKKSDIKLIEKFIKYFGPGICFHLVHMGNTVSGHIYMIQRLKKWLEDGYNIICDTSLARGFSVRWLIDLASNDSFLRKTILFASDEPWGILSSELIKVLDAAGENKMMADAIIWGNAFHSYCRES